MWKSIFNKFEQVISLTAYTMVGTIFFLIVSPFVLFAISRTLFQIDFFTILELSPIFGSIIGYNARKFDQKREENKRLKEFLKKEELSANKKFSNESVRSLR